MKHSKQRRLGLAAMLRSRNAVRSCAPLCCRNPCMQHCCSPTMQRTISCLHPPAPMLSLPRQEQQRVPTYPQLREQQPRMAPTPQQQTASSRSPLLCWRDWSAVSSWCPLCNKRSSSLSAHNLLCLLQVVLAFYCLKKRLNFARF
jgi:hypothetical protein